MKSERSMRTSSTDADACSPIKEHLRTRATAGFNFIGKLLIEKLLRHDMSKIYLPARSKKGKSIAERF